jgi:hypothetical protein
MILQSICIDDEWVQKTAIYLQIYQADALTILITCNILLYFDLYRQLETEDRG